MHCLLSLMIFLIYYFTYVGSICLCIYLVSFLFTGFMIDLPCVFSLNVQNKYIKSLRYTKYTKRCFHIFKCFLYIHGLNSKTYSTSVKTLEILFQVPSRPRIVSLGMEVQSPSFFFFLVFFSNFLTDF